MKNGKFSEIDVIGADLERFFSRAADLGIVLKNIHMSDEITASFSLRSSDINLLSEIADAYGCEFKVRESGKTERRLPERHRPIFFIGICFLFVLYLFLQNRVLSIKVEGNSRLEAAYILEQAEHCGLGFGVCRKHLRSEAIKNKLLSSVPELSWVGINTYGCTAVIRVEERALQERRKERCSAAAIVAKCDGIIESLSATSGVSLCKEGEAVSKGQTLISGYEFVKKIPVCRGAEGEIRAKTVHEVTAIIPEPTVTFGEINSSRSAYTLTVGKKKYLFSKNSGNLTSFCDRIEKKKNLFLPGNFCLPVSFSRLLLTEKECDEEVSAVKCGSDILKTYLDRHMVAGHITDYTVKSRSVAGGTEIVGIFDCIEDIGIVQTEDA